MCASAEIFSCKRYLWIAAQNLRREREINYQMCRASTIRFSIPKVGRNEGVRISNLLEICGHCANVSNCNNYTYKRTRIA